MDPNQVRQTALRGGQFNDSFIPDTPVLAATRPFTHAENIERFLTSGGVEGIGSGSSMATTPLEDLGQSFIPINNASVATAAGAPYDIDAYHNDSPTQASPVTPTLLATASGGSGGTAMESPPVSYTSPPQLYHSPTRGIDANNNNNSSTSVSFVQSDTELQPPPQRIGTPPTARRVDPAFGMQQQQPPIAHPAPRVQQQQTPPPQPQYRNPADTMLSTSNVHVDNFPRSMPIANFPPSTTAGPPLQNSESELRSLFATSSSGPVDGAARRAPSMRAPPQHLYHSTPLQPPPGALYATTTSSNTRVPTGGGGSAGGSQSSRRRGNLQSGVPGASGSWMASEHAGFGRVSPSNNNIPSSGPRPQWVSAVQRIRHDDRSPIYEAALPPDINKMGMPSRQRQGVLTASRLRAFEESGQHDGGGMRSDTSRESPSHQRGYHVRAQSDQSYRRSHIRTSAQHSGSDRSLRAANLSPKQQVITQTEIAGQLVAKDSSDQRAAGQKQKGVSFTSTMASALPSLFSAKSSKLSAPAPTTEAAMVVPGTLFAYDEQSAAPVPPNGGGGGGPKKTRAEVENSNYKSKDMRKAMAAEEEDERDERHFRNRNINALHAIPWDQRRELPMTGFGRMFSKMLSTPRFWEKIDWTFRGSILTVLPTMILSLEPATRSIVPVGFASSLAFFAFWITMPTFGSGLFEFIATLKGFTMGLILLCVVVGARPAEHWMSIICLFSLTLFSSFIAEESKKTAAFVLASTIMEYVNEPTHVTFKYVGDYYVTLLIALAFGVAGFLIPFIRWSSWSARHYISALGNALSIEVQGICSSFWVRTPLERELNLVHIRQLRTTAEKCMQKAAAALDESDYEPHKGVYRAHMRVRLAFCRSVHNILGSMIHVIELIADNPSLIDTPLCIDFGSAISDDLAMISAAMDSMILKIVDFKNIVSPAEVSYFRDAHARFQDAVSRVREDVILTNENYVTDESDVFLGFYMFSVDELCETIGSFKEEANPKNSLIHALEFPFRDIRSVRNAFRSLFRTIYYRGKITRRMKEAIKLSLCVTVPVVFQVYAMSNSPTSAMAGASIIALVYNPTGSESFHYASGRLLGTVLGSLLALMSVQIANERRPVLYVFITLLSIVGAYVQAAPGFYALGNAIVCSTISIVTQYKDQSAAMTRINQNCFAILIYFMITCIIWPVRAHTRVRMGLDISLRCLREASVRLLRNLDMPPDATEVIADVSALLKEMRKKVEQQRRFIPGAIEEPTIISAEYPEDQWKRVVFAEKKLHSALSMMRFAYYTFMSSRTDVGADISVHWVVLHRISPFAQDLADLIHASVDLLLLSLSKTTVVPTQYLTRLRASMMEAHLAILDTYIRTIQRKVDGCDDSDMDPDDRDMMDYDRVSSNVGSGGSGGGGGGGDYNEVSKPHVSRKEDDKDNDNEPNENAPKKTGYLSYGMTESEAEALRNYVTRGNPNVPNASMGKSLHGEDKDNDELPDAANTLGGTTRNNDVLLHALAGNDDGLVDALRRKHKKRKQQSDANKNESSNPNIDGGEEDPMTKLQNTSFFLKNSSLLNSFFRKKSFDPNASVAAAATAALAGGGGDDKSQQSQQAAPAESSGGGGGSTNLFTSFFQKKKKPQKPPAEGAAEKEGEEENDEQSNTNGDNTADREGSAKAREGADPQSSRRTSQDTSNRSIADGDTPATVANATYTPVRERSTTRQDGGNKMPGSLLNNNVSTATEPPPPLPVERPLVITASAQDGDDASPPPPLAATVSSRTADDVTVAKYSGRIAADADAPPGPIVSLPEIVVEMKSTGAATTTVNNNASNSNPHSNNTKHVMIADGAAACFGTDTSNMNSNMGSSEQLLPPHKHAGGGGVGSSNGCGSHQSDSDHMRNMSFFDPEKGEFILTNHDIHSLEAFLFGTRALVVYMNELQTAITEMQHANEIAKQL